MRLMYVKLTRTPLLLAVLLYAAVGIAQAQTPAEECPVSASELRRNVGGAAQSLQAKAQKLAPPFSEFEPPTLRNLSQIQPNKAMQSLGEQANRVRQVEWREGAKALASGASSGAAQGWASVKNRVAPVSASCMQKWAGQVYSVTRGVPEPNLAEPVRERVPEQLEPTTLIELEVVTGVMDSLRRALTDRVMRPSAVWEAGSSAIGAVADTFPTAFRLVKYYVIWVFSTSILVSVLLLVVLARLAYILLFSPRRTGDAK